MTTDQMTTADASNPDVNPRCYFDMTMDGMPLGRIVMELFMQIAPKTCENFKSLCLGSVESEKYGKLSFKKSIFHRIIKGFMCQGGDFTNGNGTGGVSIYGEKFEDENFILKHDSPGLLSMANAGANTNGSQFFITTVPTPHLNGKHVVFGKVIKGMNVVRKMENCEKGEQDCPLKTIMIEECGVLNPGEPDGISTPLDGDVYEDYPEDMKELQPQEYLQIATEIKAMGNAAFKQGKTDVALEKYSKCIRYLNALHPSPEDLQELTMDQKKTFFNTKVSCLLNSAMCELKSNANLSAIESADRVLYLDNQLKNRTDELKNCIAESELTKAYFRKGCAQRNALDFDGAIQSLVKAMELSPQDKLIAREHALTLKSIKDRKEKEKKIYSKMFE